jgi:DNA repair protein RadC
MTKVDYKDMSRGELIELLDKVREYKGGTEGRIRFPQDVLPHVKGLKGKKQETFMVLVLNGSHKVIGKRVVSVGTVNRTIVHPREVYRYAISKGGVAVVVVHNHPSGGLEPSKADREVTGRLKVAGELIGIGLLDHMIVGKDGGYYSFLEAEGVV